MNALQLPTEYPPPANRRPSTPGLSRTRWADHYAYLERTWEPGQHVSIIAPTDGGKTHLITRGLLPLWDNPEHPKAAYPVLFLDFKDDDPLLRGYANRVDKFPSRMQRWGAKPWWRLRVPSLFQGSTRGEQQRTVYDAIRAAYREGGWVIVVDEFRPLLNLKLDDYAVEIWERGRTQGITFIVGTQAPRWMPGHLYDQCSHAYLGRVTDRRVQVRLREIGGYSDALGKAITSLQRRQFTYISGPFERAEIVKVGAR